MSSIRRVQAALAEALVDTLGVGTTVEHRANHTGVGKLSFAVRRGRDRLWAKVAADAEEEAALDTWARVADLLADRHAAPPVLDVLRVAGRTALLFDFVDAEVATRASLHRRYDEARAVLDGLHADGGLAALLGPGTTTAASFGAVWIERFAGDLEVVAGYLPRDVLAFLEAEVDALAGDVARLTGAVAAACHGDPWHENWLLGADRVWLLDWEDLAVGDPVVDDAILLDDALGTDPGHWPDSDRHRVARRALMLDKVVDVAADWVENSDPLVRRGKDAAWRAGLEAYLNGLSG